MFHSHHVDDIGRVLLQAQEDIAALRGRIGQEGTSNADLEAILGRAEGDLRAKAELVLSAVTQNNAAALAPVQQQNSQNFGSYGGNFQSQRTPSPYHHYDESDDYWSRGGNGGNGTQQQSPAGYATANSRPSEHSRKRQSRRQRAPQPPLPSRARERLDDARAYEYMRNPTSDPARMYLRERFGIPYTKPSPLEHGRNRRGKGSKKLRKGPTQKPAGVLPVRNRVDPAAPPPDISEKDIQGGIMNLVNRGFIPPNVDLSAAFSRGAPPVTQAPVRLHQFQEQFQPTQPYVAPFLSDIANIKLDVAHVVKTREDTKRRQERAVQDAEDRARQQRLDAQLQAHTSTSSVSNSQVFDMGSLGPGPSNSNIGGSGSKIDNEGTKVAIDKIRGYNELLDQYSLHQFIIRRGKVLDMTPEFQSFKRMHVADWGPITTVVRLLEQLLEKFSVPMAYIDGHSVLQLAERAELDARPTPEQLLECIANVDQVGSLIRIPGRRFTNDEGGRNRASLVIQTSWRRFLCRREYVAYQSANEAASKIQLGWRQAQQYQEARQKIRDQRGRDEDVWNSLCASLKTKWKDLKRKRHVVIHLPSMSREEHQRASIPHLQSRMNLQMVRLCNTADPLVDVVYVAPMEIPDDVKRYYSRLLEVGGVKDPNLRYKIVVPENAERFPPHIALTSLLLYSPRCLRRIKRFIKGRDAYIVPDSVGPEERRLAVLLGVPILAPEPSVAAQYSLKSGAKRLFASADVSTAPGAHDIYEEPELIGALSKLIAAYIDVPRWVIKLDDEFAGRGHAFFNTDNLVIVRSLREAHRKHSVREPNYWGRADVQEGAREQLTRELEVRLKSLLQLNREECYSNGLSDFMVAMGRCGAVVEAVAGDVRGSPSVNLFISPDGNVQVRFDILFTCYIHYFFGLFVRCKYIKIHFFVHLLTSSFIALYFLFFFVLYVLLSPSSLFSFITDDKHS